MSLADLSDLLARSLDENLHTRHGPMRTFLILARYASRTVYQEKLENLSGSLLWPRNWLSFFKAIAYHAKTKMKLSVYECWLDINTALGYDAAP